MGYEPILEASILPANNWHPRRDSNPYVFWFEARRLIRFGYEGRVPMAWGLWFTVSMTGHQYDWWIRQVLTLRTLGFNQALYPLSYRSYRNECLQG